MHPVLDWLLLQLWLPRMGLYAYEFLEQKKRLFPLLWRCYHMNDYHTLYGYNTAGSVQEKVRKIVVLQRSYCQHSF